MGYGAFTSGMIVAGGEVFFIVGAFISRQATTGTLQSWGLVILAMLAITASNFLVGAHLLSAFPDGSSGADVSSLVFVLSGRSLGSACRGIIAFQVRALATQVSTAKDMKIVSMAFPIASCSGIALGPFVPALIQAFRWLDLKTPHDRTGVAMLSMAILTFATFTLSCIWIPHNTKPLRPIVVDASDPQRMDRIQTLRFVPLHVRERIVKYAIGFGVERAFFIMAIETGSSLMLETLYDWNQARVGLAVGSVAMIAMLVSTLAAVVVKLNWLDASTAVLCCGSLTPFAACCLFNMSLGPFQLICADAVLYSCWLTSLGIVIGFANETVASFDGYSWYTIENYTWFLQTFEVIARWLAAMLIRLLIDMFGRSAYATCLATLVIASVVGQIQLVTLWRSTCHSSVIASKLRQ
eukprot:TRINITY_DN54180_c0_g1_i1.p1 TRINITY_DN54180_c0_g1~~TRINITY_DN54180_c0_g1_i1.p1  ORF type:complete len:410 (-),score=36.70 TRINITY_DN54180_c0_g1_i1:29-1258(-)